jgi:ribosome-binding factor A
MTHRAHRTPSQRPLRVGEELRHALAGVFERGELRDPVLSGVPVTVSEVRVSPDLRHATVYVLPLGGSHGAEVIAALSRAAGFLRTRAAERVRLKYIPEFAFRLDETFAQASHISDLLANARAEGPSRDAADGDGRDAPVSKGAARA